VGGGGGQQTRTVLAACQHGPCQAVAGGGHCSTGPSSCHMIGAANLAGSSQALVEGVQTLQCSNSSMAAQQCTAPLGDSIAVAVPVTACAHTACAARRRFTALPVTCCQHCSSSLQSFPPPRPSQRWASSLVQAAPPVCPHWLLRAGRMRGS
jgi:hypothetical protein